MIDFREVLSQIRPFYWVEWCSCTPKHEFFFSLLSLPPCSPSLTSFSASIPACLNRSPAPASEWRDLLSARVFRMSLQILLTHTCASASQRRHCSARQEGKNDHLTQQSSRDGYLITGWVSFPWQCSGSDPGDAGRLWKGPTFPSGGWGRWY